MSETDTNVVAAGGDAAAPATVMGQAAIAHLRLLEAYHALRVADAVASPVESLVLSERIRGVREQMNAVDVLIKALRDNGTTGVFG